MTQAIGEHWYVLTAVCTLLWGVSFSKWTHPIQVYDLPASLSTPLEAYLGLPDSKYAYLISALYTAYAAPNTILPLLSGPLVQRLGEKFALLFTLMNVVVGQLIFALSVNVRSQAGMILGRVLYGLGGEIIVILAIEIITRWFRDKRLSLTLALSLASLKLGNVTSSIIIPRLIEPHGVVATGWIGTGLSLGACLSSGFYLVSIANVKRKDASTGEANVEGGETARNANGRSSLFNYPYVFWQLGLVCMLGYGGINTFTNSAQRYLASTFYAGDQRAAGSAKSITYILSIVLIPPLGPLLDLPIFSCHPVSLLITNLLMLVAHSLFLTRTDMGPIFPLCLLGVAFALFGVAFWAGLTRCLLFVAKSASAKGRVNIHSAPEQTYGTIDSDAEDNRESKDSVHYDEVVASGFGIMASLTNLATGAGAILLAGAENIAGYTGLEMVFLTFAFFGCLASVHLALIWNGI